MKMTTLLMLLSLTSFNTFANDVTCEDKAIDYIQAVANLEMDDALISSAQKNEEESTQYSTVYDVAGSASEGWYNLYYKIRFQGNCGTMEEIEFIEGHF